MKDKLYNQVIELLIYEREKIIIKLKKNKSHSKNLEYKIELDNAINCLNFCQRYNILPKKIKNIIELPDMNTGFSEYRIMNDCETDDRKYWIELKVNNENISLLPNDIIIERIS